MKLNRTASLVVASVAAMGLLTSCTAADPTPERTAVANFPTQWEDEITIDVFDGLANYMGVQEGWFAKLVKDKLATGDDAAAHLYRAHDATVSPAGVAPTSTSTPDLVGATAGARSEGEA